MGLLKHIEKPVDPKVQEAYDKALLEEQIEQAKQKAKRDAQTQANQTPFYKKLLNGIEAVGRDIANSGEYVQLPEIDPLTGVRLREPTIKRRRK